MFFVWVFSFFNIKTHMKNLLKRILKINKSIFFFLNFGKSKIIIYKKIAQINFVERKENLNFWNIKSNFNDQTEPLPHK